MKDASSMSQKENLANIEKNFESTWKHLYPEIDHRARFDSLLYDNSVKTVNDELSLSEIINQDFKENCIEKLIEETQNLLSRCISTRHFLHELQRKMISFVYGAVIERLKIEHQRSLIGIGQYSSTARIEAIRKCVARSIRVTSDKKMSLLDQRIRDRNGEEIRKTNRFLYAVALQIRLARDGEAAKEDSMNWEEYQIMEEIRAAELSKEEVKSEIISNARDYKISSIRQGFIERKEAAEKLDLRRRDATLSWKLASARSMEGLRYGDRLREAHKLFITDYCNAWVRGRAIERGMSIIFGETVNVPEDCAENFDQFVLAMRKQIDLFSRKSWKSVDERYAFDLSDVWGANWHEEARRKQLIFSMPESLLPTGKNSKVLEVRGYLDNYSGPPVAGVQVIMPPQTSKFGGSSGVVSLNDLMRENGTGRNGFLDREEVLNFNATGDWIFDFQSSNIGTECKGASMMLEISLRHYG